jgi:hypothetical protein
MLTGVSNIETLIVSALLTFLVRWHAGSGSLPPGDTISAQLAGPLGQVLQNKLQSKITLQNGIFQSEG